MASEAIAASTSLGHQNLMVKFDDLVARGVVPCSQPAITRLKDRDLQALRHVRNSNFGPVKHLQAKPQSGEPLPVASGNNTFGPGSDMALVHPDLVIANINDTHLLVGNLYCVLRPQLMPLTKDSYWRQHESLGAEDLDAAMAVLVAIHKPFYAMFNCSAMARASREHKHMHILPSDVEIESGGIPPVEAQLNKLPFQSFGVRGL